MRTKMLVTFVFVFLYMACAYCLDEEAINANDIDRYPDCDAVRKQGGYTKTGVYQLWMNSTAFKIICIHEENNSFNVIQRRMNGGETFTRGWHDYQYGFGHTQGDYWAGLNQIYYLTSTGNTIMTVNLQDWAGNNRNARYYFKLSDASTNFILSISQYSGDAGDSMLHNNGMPFSTFDKPDRNQCAQHYQGGWWFNYCTYAFLNGKYYIGGPYKPSGPYYDGIYWYTWGGYGYSMKFAQMMLSNS